MNDQKKEDKLSIISKIRSKKTAILLKLCYLDTPLENMYIKYLLELIFILM